VSLAKVEEVVLKKAQQEAAALVQEAARAADAHREKESARLKAQHTQRVESARAEMQAALERELNAKESEGRRQLLGRKNELIGQVFDQAAERIISLPADGYRDWLKRQLRRVPPMDQATIRVAARDKAPVASVLAELGRPDLRLDEAPADIRGGFLVQGKSFDMDFSLDSLLGVLRESLAEKATAKLFGDLAL